MSGGVDSSVAAALLKESGYDVTGVTMRLVPSFPDSPAAITDPVEEARQVSRILNIPHKIFDFTRDLRKDIIDHFTREYADGRTPNPCVRCNQYIKFGRLYEKARSLGADYLATGHYARLQFSAKQKRYLLRKAEDKTKDQSYFLYKLRRDILPFILFPLGGLTKVQVRGLARRWKLGTAGKAESQDICFVSDSGYKKFIEENLGPEAVLPGPFKNEKGKEIGRHKGIVHYTIGQRDGLGLAMGYPVYVYRIDKSTNSVHVGPAEYLEAKGLWASDYNFVSREPPKGTVPVQARIRYHSREAKAYLTCWGPDRLKVEFAKPQKSVTPGQSVVFYQRDLLLGGAVIDEAFS